MVSLAELVFLWTGYHFPNVVAIAEHVRQALVGDVEHIDEGLNEALLEELAGNALPAANLLLLGPDEGLNKSRATLSLSLFSLFSVTFELCSDSSLRWVGGCGKVVCAFVGTLIGLNFFSFSLFYVSAARGT